MFHKKSRENPRMHLHVSVKIIYLKVSISTHRELVLPFSIEEDHPFLIDRLLKKVKKKPLNLSRSFETMQREFEVDLKDLFYDTPTIINDKKTSNQWTKVLLRLVKMYIVHV